MIQPVFYFFAALTLLFALLVITAKNPVHSVIYLVLTFFTITAHYVLLNAQFLAIVNLIVYAGAIMVLFLFVIMLLNLNEETEPQKSNLVKIGGAIAGGLLLVVLAGALKGAGATAANALPNNELGLVKNLGKVLFNEFLLPFEITSILLLAAMVGAVLLASKEKN